MPNSLEVLQQLLSDLYTAPEEAMPKAELATTRAIELNGRLSSPHISLSMVKLRFDWDWPGAENELKRAIELSPAGDPIPHQLYGWYLMAEGRFPEARREMKVAIALDPSSDFYFWELGLCCCCARQYDDAVEQDRRAIALQPNSYWPHMLLGWTLEQQGKFDEAVSEMTIASRLTDTPRRLPALAHALANRRQAHGGGTLTSGADRISKRRYVSPYDVATVYAGNADAKQTLTFLERACEEQIRVAAGVAEDRSEVRWGARTGAFFSVAKTCGQRPALNALSCPDEMPASDRVKCLVISTPE